MRKVGLFYAVGPLYVKTNINAGTLKDWLVPA